ncbi:tetraprenyl-beta-curcumene synthase family protein [Fictibacillus phosphorivorans]|uniref:tetraprenyl-beta-curcumene synthase family protein n=1 Tax=Fictibacillus phosphorivorans TaxID=1221500 RepID=UPI0035E7DE72
MNKVPVHPWGLMYSVYTQIFPAVSHLLKTWHDRAEKIPNPELRKQAVSSISDKMFHCEGGAILTLLAGNQRKKAIEFVVAYQTISDYLDNLCDRSTSLNEKDFRALHESMFHALSPGAIPTNYYRYREEQDDGGYLNELVYTCQSVLSEMKAYPNIASELIGLASIYCDLQVHKHVIVQEREPRLISWFGEYQSVLPDITWYEFSACAGSTLGIFCLVSYAFQGNFTKESAATIKKGYFPWLQGLHILLDYFIDQNEDKLEGDLNFCTYYKNDQHMLERMVYFAEKAEKSCANLPNSRFHRLIQRGLLGIYLADRKVSESPGIKKMAAKLVKVGGVTSYFFYVNRKLYQRLKPSIS